MEDSVYQDELLLLCGHEELYVSTRVENYSKKKSGVVSYHEQSFPPLLSSYCQRKIHFRGLFDV